MKIDIESLPPVVRYLHDNAEKPFTMGYFIAYPERLNLPRLAQLDSRTIEADIERARREYGCPIVSGSFGYCWTWDYERVRDYVGAAWRRIATQRRNVQSLSRKVRDNWFPDMPPIQLDLFEEDD